MPFTLNDLPLNLQDLLPIKWSESESNKSREKGGTRDFSHLGMNAPVPNSADTPLLWALTVVGRFGGKERMMLISAFLELGADPYHENAEQMSAVKKVNEFFCAGQISETIYKKLLNLFRRLQELPIEIQRLFPENCDLSKNINSICVPVTAEVASQDMILYARRTFRTTHEFGTSEDYLSPLAFALSLDESKKAEKVQLIDNLLKCGASPNSINFGIINQVVFGRRPSAGKPTAAHPEILQAFINAGLDFTRRYVVVGLNIILGDGLRSRNENTILDIMYEGKGEPDMRYTLARFYEREGISLGKDLWLKDTTFALVITHIYEQSRPIIIGKTYRKLIDAKQIEDILLQSFPTELITLISDYFGYYYPLREFTAMRKQESLEAILINGKYLSENKNKQKPSGEDIERMRQEIENTRFCKSRMQVPYLPYASSSASCSTSALASSSSSSISSSSSSASASSSSSALR